MRYLTYDEYVAIGGELDQAAFERNIDRACAIIDRYTQNRLQAVLTPSDRVRACIRDILELSARDSAISGDIVASRSQSAGGVSESESYVTRSTAETAELAGSIIYDYLASETDDKGTPLLYRGCMA